MFSWVCPQSHKFLVEQGLGPVKCLTAKPQAACLFSFSGFHGVAQAVQHPLLLCTVAAGSTVLSFAFVGSTVLSFPFVLEKSRMKWSASFWTEGNGSFNPKGRFLLFISVSLEKSAPLPRLWLVSVVWCSAVPAVNVLFCPLCPPGPSRCPHCAGDAPSGCGQSFCVFVPGYNLAPWLWF